MVNGRTLEEELKNIERFFQEMSCDDFDEMMIECGINDIKESYQSNYVLACESILISGQRYVNCPPKHYGYEFAKVFDKRYVGQDMNLGAA